MSAIAFQTDHVFSYGVLETVGPGIRRLTARNPSAFTFHGTGTYVVGEGRVAVIDPGPDDPTHIQTLVASLAKERITDILVTHCHMDHSPGARLLQSLTGAQTLGYGPHGFHVGEDGDSGEEGIDMDFVPDRVLEDGEAIVAGETEFECIHTPGHTSNHMCFARSKSGDLFTGDHVMAWSTSVIIPPYGDMAEYLASLKKLLNRQDQRYWPTHGPSLANPHSYVQSLIDHRLQRISDILEFLATGPRRIADMVSVLYPGLDPRLIGGAQRSIFASILYLINKGQLASEGPPTLNALFALKSGNPNER